MNLARGLLGFVGGASKGAADYLMYDLKAKREAELADAKALRDHSLAMERDKWNVGEQERLDIAKEERAQRDKDSELDADIHINGKIATKGQVKQAAADVAKTEELFRSPQGEEYSEEDVESARRGDGLLLSSSKAATAETRLALTEQKNEIYKLLVEGKISAKEAELELVKQRMELAQEKAARGSGGGDTKEETAIANIEKAAVNYEKLAENSTSEPEREAYRKMARAYTAEAMKRRGLPVVAPDQPKAEQKPKEKNRMFGSVSDFLSGSKKKSGGLEQFMY